MESIIIAVICAVCSMLIMIQYAPICNDMPVGDFILAGIIFIIGGPFFAIVNVLEALLDTIMPEGWDQDG